MSTYGTRSGPSGSLHFSTWCVGMSMTYAGFSGITSPHTSGYVSGPPRLPGPKVAKKIRECALRSKCYSVSFFAYTVVLSVIYRSHSSRNFGVAIDSLHT